MTPNPMTPESLTPAELQEQEQRLAQFEQTLAAFEPINPAARLAKLEAAFAEALQRIAALEAKQ
ncbi:MAG: hypothetical protein JNM70_01160 [Anaerolineae bacterium]|nr:hypothetical protein [Anaerolineae bacterium]